MFSSIHPFRLFLFFLFFSKLLFAGDMPSVMAKPEIKEIPYQDVLNLILNQNFKNLKICLYPMVTLSEYCRLVIIQSLLQGLLLWKVHCARRQ